MSSSAGPALPPAASAWLAPALCIASLALWFFLGFPWQHHNESLVWDIELRRASFWDTLMSNPISTVQTYRPLGVGLAWLTFRATDGGLWLQQLINFVSTALAWTLAMRSVRNRLAFAWLSFVCGAGFFAGYIYLFHLHGVFYGPLFMFLALLMWKDASSLAITWQTVPSLLATAVFAAMFHPFALVLLVAFVAGRWLQNRLQARPAQLSAAIGAIAAAGVAMKLLASGAGDLGRGGPLAGLLASYRGLEFHRLLAALSIGLAVLTAISVPTTPARRSVLACLALAVGLALVVLGQPAILAWILACLLKCASRRELTRAALIGACAMIPAATGTGSPTYAVFVLMPCVAATVEALELPAWLGTTSVHVRLGALVASFALLVALRAQVEVPLISSLISPLHSEREKAEQMAAAFAWIDAHPQLSGSLRLCHPAELPVHSGGAVDRRLRAPTAEWPFEYYVKARYGGRLSGDGPRLAACFGGEMPPDADPVWTMAGKWAGTASIQRFEGSIR